MIRQANILFIQSSISGNDIGLRIPLACNAYYQQLIGSSLTRSIYTKEGFESLGRQLAAIASHAYFAKQIKVVEQTSQLMLALPVSNQLKAVARYYQAICVKKKGDFHAARRILERVLEEATPQYKARALLSIGATYFDSGEAELSLPFYLSSGNAARNHDLVSFVESQRQIAIIRSIRGDHKQALDDLEKLFPIVQAIGKYHPALYYDFLNSIAVELGEVGRVAEAEAACAITLASPFAVTHLHWKETRDEIAAKRTSATRSVVAVTIAPERKIKRATALKLIWAARLKASFQISLKAIARYQPIRGILDRAHYDARPRAPPALS